MKLNKSLFCRAVLAGICFAGLETSIYKFSIETEFVRVGISFAIATLVAGLMYCLLSKRTWALQAASVIVSLFVIASLMAIQTISKQTTFSSSDFWSIVQIGIYGLAVFWRNCLLAILIYSVTDKILFRHFQT